MTYFKDSVERMDGHIFKKSKIDTFVLIKRYRIFRSIGFLVLSCNANDQEFAPHSQVYTANILLAGVASNSCHILIHSLYIVYTLPVVQAMYRGSVNITHTYGRYYPINHLLIPTTCLYGTDNLQDLPTLYPLGHTIFAV